MLSLLLFGFPGGAEAQSTVPASITFIAPQREARYVAPTAPVLYVTAYPSNGPPAGPPPSVAYVEFFDGETVIGTVTASNSDPVGRGYALVWNNPSLGMHLIRARVTDTLGYSATTDDPSLRMYPIIVSIVAPNPQPQINLTAPTTGQLFTPAGYVPLAATATSAQASIRRVEFVAGDTVVAAAYSPPYSAQWNNPPPGNFTLVAKAYDDHGMVAASPAAYVGVQAPRAPLIVVTAPSPGATVQGSAPLTLSAVALAPDGAIGRVDFYAGTNLVGSSATPPYTFSWVSPQTGAVSLTAKAYDLQGASVTSAPVTVTVSGGAAPVVSLTAPAAGASFTVPATIGLSATASEAGGTITKVEFFANGASVGIKTTPPYNLSWVATVANSYTLIAKATDGKGATTISSPITVTVLGNAAPSISLIAPQNAAQYAQGQPIVLTASAATPSRTIDRVEFYADAALLHAVTVSGAVAKATVSFTWSSAGVGTHTLSAKVFAADGTSAESASINITVGDLSVALTEPYAGQVYQIADDIRISANPTETTGAIAQVDFYGDGALLGSVTAAPYTVLWSSVAVGSHTVTATARDTAGLSASSAPATVSVVVAPTLQIDAGTDGVSISDDNAMLSGTVQAPPNSAVIINGQAAALDQSGHFFANNVQLVPGANVVTFVLNTLDSEPITKSISLNSTAVAPFTVALDKQEGLAPFTTNLTITNRGNVAFQRIELDVNDDGTPEQTLASLTDGTTVQVLTYSNPGTYTLRVTVYDASNAVIYLTRRKVHVYAPVELGLKVINVYKGMVSRLIANDPTSAVRYFTGDSQNQYASVFNALGSSLSAVAGQLGALVDGVVAEAFTELTLARETAGGRQAYVIHLIRGGDGIWRIESM